MTQRLFWQDAYATSFTAHVEAVHEGHVRLDRTLFYPEAGGQSADQGVLHWSGGRAMVTDVQKRAHDHGVHDRHHEAVWHLLDGPLPPVGASVQGELDWTRRYRHMQRHTGEHLLAQAFLRVNPDFRVAAVSMRSAFCTLDLEGLPGEVDARAAEALLADVIRADLPVTTFEVSARELSAYPLRRPPQVSGNVRLVGVRSQEAWWELSACGGTHLKSTAFAAPVVVLHHERVKGGLTRVTFMAGEEAAAFLGETYRSARMAAQLLSVPPERLTERLQATLEEAAHLRTDLDRARTELAVLLVEAAPAFPVRVGAVSMDGVSIDGVSIDTVPTGELRLVRVGDDALLTPALKALLACPNTLGVVTSPQGRCGAASSLPEAHAGRLLGAWLAQSGGRGGGKADMAQGQAQDVTAFEAAVRNWQTQG